MLLYEGGCAILLSGHLRNFEECFQSFKENILDHNYCHIYMQIYASDLPKLSLAMQLYKPQRVLIEKPVQDFVPSVAWKSATNPISYYWQCKNLRTAFGLVPNNYSCVVKARYDIKFRVPIKFLEFDMRQINIPAHRQNLFGPNTITDVFAFSSYKNMDYYTSIYNFIDNYIRQGISCVPESLLAHHLRNKSLCRPIFPIFLRNLCMTAPHGHKELWTGPPPETS